MCDEHTRRLVQLAFLQFYIDLKQLRFENEILLKVLIYSFAGEVKYFCELIFGLILEKSLKHC